MKDDWSTPELLCFSLMIGDFYDLRQVLFDIRAGNSNLAKSLSKKSNHAMYQDENLHTCLLSLHTYQN